MKDLLEKLKGKKTFLVMVILVVLGALQGLDIFVLPEWVWPVLGGIGLGTLRSGVNTIAAEIRAKK